MRAQGHPELGSAIDEELRAAKQEHPGKLTVEVEMGKAKAPTEGRFRELLDRAVRIAEINAEMNPAA